ncbi:unnamed protein product, partial [Pocillopora meandrina]
IVWIFSTGLGTLLFLAKIAILCWVKFYNHSEPAAVAASVVLVPVCIVLIANQLYTDTGTALSSQAASPCPYHRSPADPNIAWMETLFRIE